MSDHVQLVIADRVQHERADLDRLHHARERHLGAARLLHVAERVADAEFRRPVLRELADVRANWPGTQDRDPDASCMVPREWFPRS